MASAIRSPSEIGTPTCLSFSSDQPLSVQVPLKSKRQSPKRTFLEASQESALTSYHLTVQGFLHGLRKSVSPPCQPAEAAQTPKLQSHASTRHVGSLFVNSVATISRSGLLDPPESTSSETDSDHVLSPPPEARRLRSPNPESVVGSVVSMKMPKVVRTYAKRIKHEPPVRNDSSTLSRTRSSTQEGALLDRPLGDGSDIPTGQSASTGNPLTKRTKKRISAVPRKRKQQTLQDDEEDRRRDGSEDDANILTSKKSSKAKRKKRRAPVNQLALVTRLPSYEVPTVNAQKASDSDKTIDVLDEHFDEQVPLTSTSPSCAKGRKPMKANVGKPVTRIRQEITIPQREALARGNFKVLPVTLRATKSPGWRLGSGFDGVTLKPSTNKGPRTSRNRKVRHAETLCSLPQSHPKLDLSNGLSPTRQSVGQKDDPKKQKDHSGPVEVRPIEPVRELGTADGAFGGGLAQRAANIGGKASFVQLASLTGLIHSPTGAHKSRTALSSHEEATVREPTQLNQSQSRILDASQSIREPSKSERNGWLKRRRVDFAVADNDEEEQLFLHTLTSSADYDGNGRQKRRNRLQQCFGNALQEQHAAKNDSQTFIGSDLTRSNPELPVISQNRDIFQDGPSQQHRRRALHDPEKKSSDSEALNHQSLNSSPESSLFPDSEADFPASAIDPTGLSMPKARHSIDVPRTSEIPETPEALREFIELDHTSTESLDPDPNPLHISETTLDSGKYFAKAVQQLELPEMVTHTVTQRRSRREPDQDVRGSPVMPRMQKGLSHHGNIGPFIGEQRAQKQEGTLQLGVTPRLRRRMSNAPFRPPFMEPLR